jgi:hypothetical protein
MADRRQLSLFPPHAAVRSLLPDPSARLDIGDSRCSRVHSPARAERWTSSRSARVAAARSLRSGDRFKQFAIHLYQRVEAAESCPSAPTA